MSPPELMIVGRLRRAHGIRGELDVEPLTDAPAAVFAAGRAIRVGTAEGDPDPAGRTLTVRRARPQGDGSILVSFDEILDRTEAERWRGRYLLAPASELEPPSEGEVYVHELAGMSVLLADGEKLGVVSDVIELPQGLALEVSRDSGSVVLPFHEEFIESVDRAARTIVATPPEGLFE
ncbi:MAG TPA: ribosome maturation factor RimM [Gemmatimonadaceae bacterium]|nr:ribosome maturation factor RimM [Gemmatimonadaceae bacterium]